MRLCLDEAETRGRQLLSDCWRFSNQVRLLKQTPSMMERLMDFPQKHTAGVQEANEELQPPCRPITTLHMFFL